MDKTIKIYRLIDGIETVVEEVANDKASFFHAIMSKNEVVVNLVSEHILDIAEGDYIRYNGIRYAINRDPEFTDKSDICHEYSIVFEHPFYIFYNKLLTNRITGSTKVVLAGSLRDWAELIIWNVNKTDDNPLGVDIGWILGKVPDTGNKTIILDAVNCRDAVTEVASAYNVEYYFDDHHLNFVERIENARDFIFTQGKGKGLYEIEQANVDDGDVVTRLYPVGGTDNVIPGEGDEEGRLILPEKYLENFSESTRIVEKKVVFNEIHPSFTGVVEKPSGENNREFICSAIDFNVQELAIGDEARVNFLTGDLMGKSFEFQWDNSAKKITLIYQEDDLAVIDPETGVKPNIPSADKYLRGGEKFNFTGIKLGESYKNAAVHKLRETGKEWLAYNSRKRVKFELSVDYHFMRGKGNLFPGDLITIKIPDRNIEKLIRITSIEKNLHTGKLTCVVSNYLDEKWEDKIESQISSLESSIATNGTNGNSYFDIIEEYDGRKMSDRNVLSSLRALREMAERTLSKIKEDSTNFLMNFLGGIVVKKFAKFGDFLTGISGGYIDENGDMEMGSGIFRKRLFVPEIAYNRTTYFKGRMVNSPGGGCSVKEWKDNGDGSYTVTPDLTDADGLSQFVDDILTTYFVTKNAAGKLNGFEEMKFRVTAADYSKKVFTLVPRPGYDWKPADQMVLAQTGNFTDPERQTYILIDSVNGNNCITFFDKANTWDVEPVQMPAWFGKKKGMTVGGIDCDNYSAVLQNILMTGLIFQIDEITGGKVRVPLDKGEWKTGRYAYYDRVSHNGSLWLCVNDKGTSSEPSPANPDWLKQVSEGKPGDTGPQGIPGPAGADGKSTYTWVRYADNAQGSGISNDPLGKSYIGFAYNKPTQTESNTPSDYTWSLIKGTDGMPGPPGADGQTTYTWVAYSDYPDGREMYQIPNDNTRYLGIAVNKTTMTESNKPSDYTWSRFRGADGLSVTGGGHWEAGKAPYKANTLVSFANCVFLSNVDTSNPPVAIARFKNGAFRRKKDGGYILAGKSVNWQVHPDWDMLLDGRELKGTSITFLGRFDTAPANPSEGNSYYNTKERATYIYRNGVWMLMVSDGKDGTSYEYIYKRTNIMLAPDKPDSKQQDDYVPEGWTDDYLGVDADHQLEWGCTRSKSNGVWSEFSTPAIVHRWSKDGTDAISADLTDEMGNVALTNKGLVQNPKSWSTYAGMWSGTEKLALTGLDVTVPSAFTYTKNVNTGLVVISVAAGKSLPEESVASIILSAGKNGQNYSRTLTFRVAAVRAGEDGADAILYSIVTSATSVSKDKNGNYDIASVSCQRMKTVGSLVTATTDGELKYSRDGGTETAIGDGVGVATNSFSKSLKFIFYVGGKVVDVETIPMIIDGKDGTKGKDGESIVSIGHWEASKTPVKANSVALFNGTSYLSLRETSSPPIAISRFKNGAYRRKKDGGYILAGRSRNKTVNPDWQVMTELPDASASYWLDSPVGTINFTATGSPSPSAFVVTCKQNVSGNVSDCNTLYLAARKFNGDWLAHVGATLSSQISVPATGGYTQFAVRAYTSASDANSWNDNYVAEKGIGVAVDGKPGDKGDTGATGAFPRDRGVFGTSDGLGAYVWNKDYRDKVIYKINEVYYNFLVRNYGASVTAAPTSVNGDSNWEAMEKFKNIATDTLFASGANIGGFMFVYKDTNLQGVPYGEMRSQDVTNGVPNLLMNTRSGYFHCMKVNITGTINAESGIFNNVKIQSGTIAGFSIAGNGLTNINEDGKFINDAYVIFRNDNYNSFAGIGGNILPPSLGGRAVARFENHDKKNKGIGGFNCAMIVSAQEANQNTAIQMNGGCISGLAYKAISVSSSETLTRDVVSVACLNTGGISITLPDMDVFDDGHVIKIKRLKGVDKDNAVRIYAGFGYHDILDETSKEYVRTKKQTCIRADATSVYALDPRILPSVGDAIELVYHRDVHYGTYSGCWVEYKHPRDW